MLKRPRSTPLTLALIGATAVALAAIWLGLVYARHRAAEYACQRQLKSLSLVLLNYRQDHKDTWPTSLAALAPKYIPASAFPYICNCPESPTRPAPGTNYIYIDWSAHPKTMRKLGVKCPLIYDASLGNHGERGINIVFLDASVIWDSEGKWLKKFIADHPEMKLPHLN